jgi:hypothetical protein
MHEGNFIPEYLSVTLPGKEGGGNDQQGITRDSAYAGMQLKNADVSG